MKRFYSRAGKIFLGITCTVFTFIFAVSVFACGILGNWGLFSSNTSEFKNELYKEAGRDYATWILYNADNGFTSGRLEGMNCYYGVIAGKETKDIDLNSDSSYIYRNFKDVKVPKNAFKNYYGIDSDTEIELSEKLLDFWTPNYIGTDYASVYTSVSIEGIGYDLIGQKAYVYGNGRFYPIQEYYCSYVTSEHPEGTPNTNNIYSRIWDNNKADLEAGREYVDYYSSSETEKVQEDESYYVVEDSEETEGSKEADTSEVTTDYLPEEIVIENGAQGTDANLLYIGGKGYKPLSDSVQGYVLALNTDDGATGKLSLDNVADLSDIHGELTQLKHEVSIDNISFFGIYEDNPDLTYYTVVCFPNETKLAANTYTNDFYAQAKAVAALAPTLKVILPLAAILSFAIALGSWIMFLCSAGHKKGVEGIVEGPVEKIPADLAIVLFIIAESIVFAACVSIVDELGSSAFGLIGMIVVATGIAAMLIGFLWSSNIAVNIKMRHIFKNSVIYRCIKVVLNWLGGLHEESKIIRSRVGWNRRIWVAYIIIIDIEIFFIWVTDSTNIVPFFIIWKVLFGFLMHKFLLYYSRIKGAAMDLAEGDTTAQVDLTGMPLFLEEHAKAMNEIQSGITVALEERTKSERMKTELITNVSHDIKTPLTSIINYVDLLEKEDIENDKAKEYLEVLDRQSKRLKKLIEDLIEASKVSTGNVNFNIEKVNAVVLLNQSIGEFSDRLDANKITVVTNIPATDAYLQADNRYLWRVFDNLMSNIVKYAQPNTRAYVDLEQDDKKLRFVFRNTSKEELNITADELMERFVRGDKSRYTDGNGLGLFIARSLTEAMGGTLKLSIDGDLFKAVVEFNKI